MKNKYDIIISGAGPSGSLLGFLLSSSGLNTLIIEKKKFPRYKICAGGIQHRTLAMLPFKVGEVFEKTIYGILFSLKARDPFVKKYDDPIMYTVDRRKFDMFMAEKAASSGCELRFGEEVKAYDINDSEVCVETGKGRYFSKILVGADGIRGLVHRKVVSDKNYKKILGYEVEARFNVQKNSRYDDCVGLDYGGTKKGYLWVFPKKEVLSCGIGGPVSTAVSMRKYLRKYLADSILEGENQDYRLLAQSIPVREDDTPLNGYRVLTVGDAACLGDGFTGEGLYNSFKSSIIASESIIKSLRSSNYYFEDYRDKINVDVFKDIKISLFFSRVFFSYPLFFYKLIKNNDKFFNLCCKVMRGEKKYSDISGKLNLYKDKK